MKPCFGLFIALVALLLVPWSRFEPMIVAVVNSTMFVFGVGCFVAIPVIFFAITIRGIRHPTT